MRLPISAVKKLLITIYFLTLLPSSINAEDQKKDKVLKITTKSSAASISLAKHLTKKGVKKYSAYWCPSCLYQSQLFGKEAYSKLTVIECAQDGKNSQTQLCNDKNIKGFPSWEINGEIFIGVQTLNELAKSSKYKGSTDF